MLRGLENENAPACVPNGLSRDAVSMTGYWRHDDHAADDEH